MSIVTENNGCKDVKHIDFSLNGDILIMIKEFTFSDVIPEKPNNEQTTV